MRENPFPPDRSRYFREFSLSVFPATLGEEETEGFLLAMEADEAFRGGWDETEEGWRMTLPAGDYVLTAGERNREGEPHVRVLPLTLESGRTLTLRIPLDPPSEK